MDEKDFLEQKNETQQSFDAKTIIRVIFAMRYWIIGSIIFCVACVFIYLKYTTPMYVRTTRIILLPEDEISSALSTRRTASGAFFNDNKEARLEAEISILRSRSLMQKVVEDLDLNIRYYTKGRFKTSELYKNSPIKLSYLLDSAAVLPNVQLTVTPGSARNTYTIENATIGTNTIKNDASFANLKFDEVLTINNFSFVISQQKKFSGNSKIIINICSSTALAPQLAGAISIKFASKTSNVSNVSMLSPTPKKAEDVLNRLIDIYNDISQDAKKEVTRNTIDFIDTRLKTLDSELGDIASDIKSYSVQTQSIGPNSKTGTAISQKASFTEQQSGLQIQIQMFRLIEECIKTNAKENTSIPVISNVADASLNSIVQTYNALILEHEKLLRSSSTTNPKVVQLAEQINQIKENILLSIGNLEKAYQIQLSEINRKISTNRNEIATIPEQQLTFAKLSREQQIKEPLYLLLSQKKEDALISMLSVPLNAKVIEKASGSRTPITPKSKQLYIFAILFGITVPTGIYILFRLLRAKVHFKTDIEARTNIPVISILPKINSAEKNITVSLYGRDALTESFRVLRSNLDLHIAKSNTNQAVVLHVTSSIAGEGKSTVSINTAITVANAGKKVLLIGTDLRKPTIAKYLHIKQKEGLSNFLAGYVSNTEDLICKYENAPNLDIILAGAVPPNPSELLLTPAFEKMLNNFRECYDYIVLDSSPFFVVSDSILMNKLADATLYVVRAGVTSLQVLDSLNELYWKNTFKQPFIVFNAVDFNSSIYNYYGYGYGKYGYGYGSGYGYGCSEEEEEEEIESSAAKVRKQWKKQRNKIVKRFSS